MHNYTSINDWTFLANALEATENARLATLKALDSITVYTRFWSLERPSYEKYPQQLISNFKLNADSPLGRNNEHVFDAQLKAAWMVFEEFWRKILDLYKELDPASAAVKNGLFFAGKHPELMQEIAKRKSIIEGWIGYEQDCRNKRNTVHKNFPDSWTDHAEKGAQIVEFMKVLGVAFYYPASLSQYDLRFLANEIRIDINA